jgi:hypothetical protein
LATIAILGVGSHNKQPSTATNSAGEAASSQYIDDLPYSVNDIF